MTRTIRLAAALAAMALLVTAATVQATSPLGVSFEVQTAFIDGGPLSGGPFTASGPAVEAGLICAAGDTIDQDLPLVAGYQSSTGANLRIVKHFSCADGSGDLWITLQARLDARGDRFVWVISDGTGAYERLHGTGSGSGVPMGNGVLDLYDGGVHLD
jgi:hypothetical protein